jgi:hypothetical protein
LAERLDRERDEIRSAIDWALMVDDAETFGWLLTSPKPSHCWRKPAADQYRIDIREIILEISC